MTQRTASHNGAVSRVPVCFELTRWIGLIAVHWPADPGERVDFEGEMVSSVLNK